MRSSSSSKVVVVQGLVFFFSKPQFLNVLFCAQPEDIRFTVTEEEINHRILTFKFFCIYCMAFCMALLIRQLQRWQETGLERGRVSRRKRAPGQDSNLGQSLCAWNSCLTQWANWHSLITTFKKLESDNLDFFLLTLLKLINYQNSCRWMPK